MNKAPTQRVQAHPEAHPLANLLPMLTGAEFDALVADIRQHGLRVPITLFDGKVLDGRNRLRACEAAGVNPRFEEFEGDGDDALAFVLSLNVARRHLTTCQRAVLALKLLPLEEGRARRRQGTRSDLHQDADGGGAGQALDQAGARVSVSRDTVWRAKRLAEHSPDVIEAMTEALVRSMPEAQRLAHVPISLRPAVFEKLRADGGRVSHALRAVRSQEQDQRVEKTPQPILVEEPGLKLIYGQHVLDALRTLSDESVHACITSPPYWGSLRDYGAPPVTWGGDGNADCEHEWRDGGQPHHRGQGQQSKSPSATAAAGAAENGNHCKRCGAWRGHLGHEPTVQMYVAHLVEVFDEIRRVLRHDGTAWLVLGDCYIVPQQASGRLKPKDLVMVPHRVALALQDAGWWVRQDICWEKVNALPESVNDRPTRSHEYVFLLAQAADYFFDADAIREPFSDPRPKVDKRGRQRGVGGRQDGHTRPHGFNPRPDAGRNRRSVWSLPTQPLPAQPGLGSHHASFPEALVEPMVLAGTSAAGACKACGAPWLRDVGDSSSEPAGRGFGVESSTTTGWRPSCECAVEEVVPCVVLDPFSGSATTGKVARDHGRSYVGIDLNAEYLPLARERIGIK